MRIATWNVNSIRTRHELVLDFLQRENIDVLAMQEIKCRPDQFSPAAFAAAGYSFVGHGYNQWNGVAFASRLPMSDIETAFPAQPGFGKPVKGQEAVQGIGANGLPLEARALGVTVEGVRLWSLYVPNGRGLEDPHYAYKLAWLTALRNASARWLQDDAQLPLALMGDFNIAPTDSDMGDPAFIPGFSTHISEPERAAFAAFLTDAQDSSTSGELYDVVRPYAPNGYTYWDYRAGKFEQNQGMRIDFILGSAAFNGATVDAWIARDERFERPPSAPLAGVKPSDHVPVVCELDLQLLDTDWDDADDAPMIW